MIYIAAVYYYYYVHAGTFKSIAVRVTRQKDVIFDIELKISIEEPLSLYLEYTDMVSGLNYTKVTSGMYMNVTTICHVEFDSQVKFDKFRVSVALQSSRGIRGPLVSGGEHGECSISDTRYLIQLHIIVHVDSS